jgi:hypothetical protein
MVFSIGRLNFSTRRDGLGVWGVDQAQLFSRGWAGGFARHGFGFLDVRGVVGTVAEDDIVFAGLGQYVEFVGAGAADGAVVGLNRAELQAQAGEHVAVGLVHAVVGDLQGRLVGVERIGVLHDELAAAHQAEAWADFVTELGLDLVQVDRQLLVAAQLVAHQIGDHFFVGRAAQKSRPWRSLKRSSSGPYSSQRPDSCHSSAGWVLGINTSREPAAFISSRTMASTLRITQPIGSQVYRPEPVCGSCRRAASAGG